MTPREKANDIYNKMEIDVNDYDSNYPTYSHKQAKECSLICVSEILKTIELENNTRSERASRMYWINVAEEIRNF